MKSFLIFILLFSFHLQAEFMQTSGGYFEVEPKMSWSHKKGNITKKEFDSLLKKIKKTYKKRVHKNGGLFKVKGKWKSNRVNAFAYRAGPIWGLTALGGLARHPLINYDGFALVLCHEMGHHLGGAPKSKTYFKRWVSFEGQADYWATLKCFRHILKDENNIQFLEEHVEEIPVWASLRCIDTYENEQDSAICIRSIMAGLTMTKLIANYKHEESPKLGNSNLTIIEKTTPWHPETQCRLDTYAQGALCPVDSLTRVDNDDPSIGTCSRENGDNQGNRPLCWYNPNTL